MREVSMIFNVKLTVEQAKEEIGIRKEPHSQTRDCSPMPHFLITDGPGNHRTCEGVCNAVHELMVTCQCPLKQRSSPLFWSRYLFLDLQKNAYFLSEFFFFAILRLVFQSLPADRPCTVLVRGRQAHKVLGLAILQFDEAPVAGKKWCHHKKVDHSKCGMRNLAEG